MRHIKSFFSKAIKFFPSQISMFPTTLPDNPQPERMDEAYPPRFVTLFVNRIQSLEYVISVWKNIEKQLAFQGV